MSELSAAVFWVMGATLLYVFLMWKKSGAEDFDPRKFLRATIIGLLVAAFAWSQQWSFDFTLQYMENLPIWGVVVGGIDQIVSFIMKKMGVKETPPPPAEVKPSG